MQNPGINLKSIILLVSKSYVNLYIIYFIKSKITKSASASFCESFLEEIDILD